METAPGAAHAERSANQVACLRFLADAGVAQTVGVISAETGLSRPTVHAVLDDLVAAGLVEPSNAASAGPGRPARSFRFVREAGLVAGVDIGPAARGRCSAIWPASDSGTPNWAAPAVVSTPR